MSIRVERVNSEIERVVSKIITKELENPLLKDEIISVSGVKTSSDFRHAKIYISILSSKNRKEIFAALKSSERFIQKRVSEELNLRFSPIINMFLDETMEKGSNVLEILKGLNISSED